jgi:hypothetical protein
MDDYEETHFLHDDGEDEFISTRPHINSLVSSLTDDFLDIDKQWSYRSKRQFNMKMRRFGPKNPEWFEPIEAKSLAQISERITHLERITARKCPLLHFFYHNDSLIPE